MDMYDRATRQGGDPGAMISRKGPTPEEIRKMCRLYEEALKGLYRYANELAANRHGEGSRHLAMHYHDMAEMAYQSTMLVVK